MNEVVSIYKPEAMTPLMIITEFKKRFPQYSEEKISVAGRLDPMASGLLLLLIGEANKERSYFQSLDKTYEFTLLLGVTTDTYDILGKITSIVKDPVTHSIEQLTSFLATLRGTSMQDYPPYSSMHVMGKPLFYWAREDKLEKITIPTKRITIQSLDFLSSSEVTKLELVEDIEQRIKKVRGNFRQKEIEEKWKESLPLLPEKLQLLSLRSQVSSGTYIRSLCFELGLLLGSGGIAYTIKRQSCGEYKVEDAIHLQLN